jgi:threonine/homoserine/homoserine lactone efflux protein
MGIDSQLIAFVGVAAVLTVIPGADTVLVVRNSAAAGARAGLWTTVGICSGLFVHATLSALGLSLLLVQSAAAFSALKLAGAVYLVWLGLLSLRAAASPADASSSGARGEGRRPVVQGLLSNVLNPKVAIFYLALLPQFIGPGDPALARSLLLASIHCALGLAWLAGIALVVSRSRHAFARSGLGRSVHALAGALLVGLGARLAFSDR